MIMSPGLRKLALSAHIIFSIGWLGAVMVFLVLSLLGYYSQDRELVRASYLVMSPITWFVIVPLAFASGLSGVVSSLGTKWGLFRYYWVLLKLVLTIPITIILMIHTQPIDHLANVAATAAVLGAGLQKMQLQMVVASGATLVVLLILTVLSVYKLRGLTPYGQWKQDEQRKDGGAIDPTTNAKQEVVRELDGGIARTATIRQ
jgi:hypothetical protein